MKISCERMISFLLCFLLCAAQGAIVKVVYDKVTHICSCISLLDGEAPPVRTNASFPPDSYRAGPSSRASSRIRAGPPLRASAFSRAGIVAVTPHSP
jgi:hypothetical protein